MKLEKNRLTFSSFNAMPTKITQRKYFGYCSLVKFVICYKLTAAVLAQSVERVTAEREVEGSIPGAGPILRVLK